MDYPGFDAEYGRVLAAAESLDRTAFAVEIERLRTLVEVVQPLADQEAAQRLMLSLDNALSAKQPPLSDSMSEALGVHRQARTTPGSARERIERVQAGITEIARIAESAEPAERTLILYLNESLSTLLEFRKLTATRGDERQ